MTMEAISEAIRRIIQKIQVNIPFTMLYESYLDKFMEFGLNPEIGLDAGALDRFSKSDFRGIAETLHENSPTITLHAPFIDLNAGSPDPAIRGITRRRLEQLLDLVPLFKPVTVVCHAGYDAKRHAYFKETWSQNSIELWSWMADRLGRHGARLMLENVYEDGPADMQLLFEGLKDQRVGFCLDAGHSMAFGQSDLKTWVDTLGPYLGQLHLHDNLGGHDEHLALGSGVIDFGIIFKYLKKFKVNGPIITLEPHEEKYLWPSLDYLAQHWPW